MWLPVGACSFFLAGRWTKRRSRFLLDVGADFQGHALYDVDYTLVDPGFASDLIQSPVLNYAPALRVESAS